MPKIAVERLTVGPLAVNCYIVENTETKECFIVDPGADSWRITACVGERSVKAVLLTHGHFDHLGAVDELCEHYHVPLYIHALDADKVSDAEGNVSKFFGLPLVQHTKPLTVQEGEPFELAGIPLEVLHTPGHSKGSACFLLPEHQGIITGDTLFSDGYGRTDFPDGDFAALMQSLKRLMRMSPRIVTYPGHGAEGMVGRGTVEG